MRSILYLYRNPGGRDRFREQTFSGIKRYAEMCNLNAVMWLDARPELVAGMLARHNPVVGCVVDCADDNAGMRQDIFGDVPVVYLHAPSTLYGRDIPRVEVDHKAVVRTVFRELSLGKPSAYAVVGVAENYSWSRTRIEFFRSLVKESGCECRVFRNGGESARRASLLARWVESLPHRTAIFAVNDSAASEIVAAAVRAGKKIPRDITLCGIDNAEEICETSEPAITSVQRDLEGEGFIAAKMLGLRISGSVSVSPLMPIRRDSTLGPKFTRKEDEYALCTPSGLILKGRVGGRYAFESVVADGLECGSFTFMVYHGDWQDIERVESAKWMPGRKALRISGVRNSGQKAFRVTCDIVPFAGKPWFGCNVVSVDNIGKENLDNVSVWLRQYAPWAKDAAFAGAVRQVPDLWKRPASGVWFRALDGAWCGAATFAKTVKTFNYYTAYDGSAHPDAEFGDSKMLNLAPGASWSPDGRVWMVAGAGFGGADGWEKFIEEFSGWWHKSGGKGKR